MKTLTVALPGREYDILIERGLLAQTGERVRAVLPRASKIAVVTDTNVGPLYYNRVKAGLESAGFETALFTIPAGEESKNAVQLAQLWEDFMGFGLTRTDAVVALGGGVVGDLAGFGAATVLRGVGLVQIPTTLLAQVDSSVGGKVAVDLKAGKNLAGAFYQPKLVLMDPDVLDTLTDRTFSDGMAEVIKYGCIWDKGFFDFLCAHPSRREIMEHIEHVLYICCDIKRQVVMEDERDTGLRMILNFGHTVGHAYERLGNYETWTHGQAVAAGMFTAMQIGVGLGITQDDDFQPFLALLKAFDLPDHIAIDNCTLEGVDDWNLVVETVGLDKKSAGDSITMIFLEKMGKALPVKMKKDDVLDNLGAVYGRN
ncbi:MAG: 3-dehydroquinate synthase [Oscillospiraceae bacterium]|nr:3-dehydroquinate synthase [Oscillospiraceae bacterium]MDE7171136.1 3-dehydroquinate synthase [Oscillospiraceae bacterium]